MKKTLLVAIALLMVFGLVLTGCAPAETKDASDNADKPANNAQSEEPKEGDTTSAEGSETEASNLDKSLALDISDVVGSDGQPLLLELEKKDVPERPADPDALPEEDPMHWYDMEYAGWGATEKTNIPESPADGCIGKKAIVIINGDHPYLTAYSNGAKIAAEAYGMEVQVMSPNWDLNVQNQQIDQAINARPDMIILIPLDAKAAVQQFRKINEAGIPCIASNMLPEAEAMKYVIGWTGPDDWGQFRMLADALADEIGGKGGVCYVQHAPGGSPYFARCWGPLSQFAANYPDMKTLDMQAPGFEADKTKQLVSDWITKYGDELTAIVAADDSAQAIGIIEALKEAGREDVKVIAAGNSKVGMDYVKSGEIYAISYQSAEADGATPIKMAADWFNGKTVDPIYYLPKHVITQADVEDFMPAQW